MSEFKVEEFEIFDIALELHHQLFGLSELTLNAKSFRIADNLRRVAVNIMNKSDKSVSVTRIEFVEFLEITRTAIFEISKLSFHAFTDNLIDYRKLEKVLGEQGIFTEKLQQSEKQFIKIIKTAK